MADVGPLSRRVRHRVERRVPRVLLRFVGGEEREVLPPHVARELRDVLLVADAQIHTWACWKTYLGRPETANARGFAMNQIGNGLYIAGHHEDALIVREAELAMMRRMEGPGREYNMLIAQGNLAITYNRLLRFEEALRLRREVFSGLLICTII